MAQHSADSVRVGIVGTSWWSDAMYLPALADHPIGRFTAICGRREAPARQAADRWGIPHVFTDATAMLDSGEIDAVIVASANDSHHPITVAAIERGLHVLCEKPLGLTAAEATEMVSAASARPELVTMTPFTYRWMPSNRFVKQLIDKGYVGDPYHLNMRYTAGYARDGAYAWRFDEEMAGSGILGDLGSHWIDMARWFLGEITSISAHVERFVPRGPRPDGSPYRQAEDAAVILARFESGAQATLQVSAVAWEGTPFGQIHALDLHGSEGTLHALNDWAATQEVRGVQAGVPGPAAMLEIPDDCWLGAPRGNVHDTYRHIFRRTESMTREWVTAIAERRHVDPDLAVGARVQHLIEACLASDAAGGVWLATPMA